MKLEDVRYRKVIAEGCWMRRSLRQSLNIAPRWATPVVLALALGIPAVSQAANQREVPFENSRIFRLDAGSGGSKRKTGGSHR
jgi:hypothetical protein